jgi:hypothetical protein
LLLLQTMGTHKNIFNIIAGTPITSAAGLRLPCQCSSEARSLVNKDTTSNKNKELMSSRAAAVDAMPPQRHAVAPPAGPHRRQLF